MRRLLAMVISGAITLLTAGYSIAGEKKVYIIGVEQIQYLPHYTYDGQEYSGFSRELFDMFAKDKGIAFQYRILPINRLFKEFLADKSQLDFKFPDSPMWKQDLKKDIKVNYSDSVVSYIDGVMVTPENLGKGKDKLKQLGTARGFTAWDYLDDIKKKEVKIVENNSFAGLLKQVIAGRVDGAYINIAVAHYQLKYVLSKTGALVFDKDLPHTKSSYYLSSVKHPELIKDFNKFMKSKAGDIAVLKQKFGVESLVN